MKDRQDCDIAQEPQLILEETSPALPSSPLPVSDRSGQTPTSNPARPKTWTTLPVVAMLAAGICLLFVSWWLGPNGYFYEFDSRSYPSMSQTERALAGIGIEMRILRAKLAHKQSWLGRSFAAKGDYKLCCGDENGAIAAYRRSIKHQMYFNSEPTEILVALYAKQGRWNDAYQLLQEKFELRSKDLEPQPYNSYSNKQFFLIAAKVCEHMKDKRAADYFAKSAAGTRSPWLASPASSGLAQDPCSELMGEGCRKLANGEYGAARDKFLWMQDPAMDQITRKRGALMAFITSVAAGDKRQAESDWPEAWSAYAYFKAAGNCHREEASFLHQYAKFLRWQGQNDTAASAEEQEAIARETQDPQLQGATNGTIGPFDEGPG
jgi:hypothetical protein